jgi:hypothetical protein
MIRVDVQASSNTNLGGPGVCALMVSGLRIVLPTWNNWPDKEHIIVKDMTGANPNCTVTAAGNGLIDGQASVTLTNAYESLTFEPFEGGNTWTIA